MGNWGDGGRFDRSRFVDTNAIRFSPSWGDAEQAWWNTHMFEPYGIYPDELGEMLSASAIGDKIVTLGKIDTYSNAFEIDVTGHIGDTGRAWFHQRRLDLSGPLFEGRKMAIPYDDQHKGRGRLLMTDLVDTAERLGISLITVEAEDIGRYAWARFGFVPDRGSWNFQVRIEAIRRLQLARGQLTAEAYAAYREVLDMEQPEMIREVASWTDMVDSRHMDDRGYPLKVELGKALLLETSANWFGDFRLDDPESMKIFRRYVGRE